MQNSLKHLLPGNFLVLSKVLLASPENSLKSKMFFFLSIKDGHSSYAKALTKPQYDVVLNLGTELVVEKHFDFQMKEKVLVPLTNLCLY